MLPDWTVKEFFEEIEKLFNVIFLNDENTKQAAVVSKSSFYDNSDKNFISEVIDSYSQEIDGENKTDYSNANIGYDLPDNEYFRFQNLDPSIMERIEYIPLPDFTEIYRYIVEHDKRLLTDKIFISEETGTQYIMWHDETALVPYEPRKVNIFRPVPNNPDNQCPDKFVTDIDVSLKIIPAPIGLNTIDVVYNSPIGPITAFKMLCPAPAIETDEYPVGSSDDGAGPVNIQEIMENGADTHKSTATQMYLAFYTGYHTVLSELANNQLAYRMFQYPVAFVDFLMEDWRSGEVIIDPDKRSLRLDHENGLKPLYDDSLKIDTTREYTFTFVHRRKLDVKNIFVIKNREFVCKELKYKITAQGREPAVEGTFYAVGEPLK